jgi:hypothetical protein
MENMCQVAKKEIAELEEAREAEMTNRKKSTGKGKERVRD